MGCWWGHSMEWDPKTKWKGERGARDMTQCLKTLDAVSVQLSIQLQDIRCSLFTSTVTHMHTNT